MGSTCLTVRGADVMLNPSCDILAGAVQSCSVKTVGSALQLSQIPRFGQVKVAGIKASFLFQLAPIRE